MFGKGRTLLHPDMAGGHDCKLDHIINRLDGGRGRKGVLTIMQDEIMSMSRDFNVLRSKY